MSWSAMPLQVGRAIAVENLAHVHVTGQEHGADIVALGHGYGAASAADRHPDRRMGLLEGTRPDVDLSVMIVAALEIEGSVVRRPCLENEVMCLPHAVGAAKRSNV